MSSSTALGNGDSVSNSSVSSISESLEITFSLCSSIAIGAYLNLRLGGSSVSPEPLASEAVTVAEVSGVHLWRSRWCGELLLLLLLRPLDLDALKTPTDEVETRTHFFFHFLTRPLNTAVAAGPLYLDDVRLNLDPTPSILFSLLSNLQRLSSLSDQCSSASFSGGKLLMQSDLDIASSSLSTHISDLDLLLRSGVLHQQNAIVLSLPPPTSDKDDIAFFIRDLFTRLQIGGAEFKKKSLESLLQLLTDNEKSARIIAKEGNVGYLVTLLDLHHHPLIREHALAAVSLLTSSSADSRKTVFEQGGLGPLLRLLETGSPPLKTRAAIAIEAITADPATAWAISAYGGVTVLIEACRSGSKQVQEHIAGAISNIAAVEEIRTTLAEEGAIPVLIQLLISGSSSVQEKTANFISLISSSGEYYRDLIVRERGGLQILIHLVQESSNPDTIEHCLLALSQISAMETVSRVLSSSTRFIIRLGELIKHGNVILQQISTSLLSNLTISDGNKRAVADCLSSLIRLMESPKPAGLQEAATEAAKSLLTVRSNRKELMRDEKSVIRLVQMLDPRNERMPNKELPVIVVTAILSGGSYAARKKLIGLGADRYLQSLEDMEVSGAKKAVQRLAAGNRLKSIFFTRSWKDH